MVRPAELTMVYSWHAHPGSAIPYRGQGLPTEGFPTFSPRRPCLIYSFWSLCQWELLGSAGVNWAIWSQLIYYFLLPVCKVFDKRAFPLEFVKPCYSLYCLACLVCEFLTNKHRITSILLITVSSVPSSVPTCHLMIFSKYMLNKWMEEQINEWTNNIFISFWLLYSPFVRPWTSSWLLSTYWNSFLLLIFSSQCLVQFLPLHPRTSVHSQLALKN